MPRSKPQPKPAPRPARASASSPPTVSGRWLLTAVAIAIPGAAFCAWAVLCLLFWQGSWQLLYHPKSAVTRTPAALGLAFDPVGFAPGDTGEPQLQGWWIPASNPPPFTVLYLHSQNGNLGDTVDTLSALHAAGVNVLAFDYRGFGQSQFVHPSEDHMFQDAVWALDYLTGTRHIDPHAIVLDGTALGANLALEVAAAHPELAGVVLDAPIDKPADAIFNDPRARLVPARLLVSDRFDMAAPAAALRVPSLWLLPAPSTGHGGSSESAKAFLKITSPKVRIWVAPRQDAKTESEKALTDWLSNLRQ